jgi:hypothetical protein
MNGNEGHWGGGISTISQNFSKSSSILFHPLECSISQTSLHRKTRRVKLHRTRIVNYKLTNGKKIMKHLRSNKDI